MTLPLDPDPSRDDSTSLGYGSAPSPESSPPGTEPAPTDATRAVAAPPDGWLSPAAAAPSEAAAGPVARADDASGTTEKSRGGTGSGSDGSSGTPSRTGSGSGSGSGSVTGSSGTSTTRVDPVFEEGQVIFKKYRLIRPLGKGGMGRVWLAYDTALERQTALKVIDPRMAQNRRIRRRFVREAQLMVRVKHPNVVELFNLDEVDGNVFIAMEALRGRTLKDVMADRRGEPLTLDEVWPIVRQLCDALAVAHEHLEDGVPLPIVHRDLKPANLMLLDGRPPGADLKVLDFGIAKILGEARDDPDRTVAGEFFGTYKYASPEQKDPEHGEVGPRSDLYSVGVIVYEMLTGRLPVSQSRAGRKGNRDPRVPRAVETVLRRCLAEDPERRPASARELKADFERAHRRAQLAAKVKPRRVAAVLGCVAAAALSWWAWDAFRPAPRALAELRLVSWGDGSGVPASGKNLVVVGTDAAGVLHVRVFDDRGYRTTDADETQLPGSKAEDVRALKGDLKALSPPHALTDPERARLLGKATQLVARTLKGSDAVPEVPPPTGYEWAGDEEPPSARYAALRRLGDGAVFLRTATGAYLPKDYEDAAPAQSAGVWPLRIRRKSDHVEFVRITGGTYLRGSHRDNKEPDAGSDEKPTHPVVVNDVYVQVNEVTNAEIAAFRESHKGVASEEAWKNWWEAAQSFAEPLRKAAGPGAAGVELLDEVKDLPAVCVDWATARLYARHVSGRLPWEAEWEFVARSCRADGRLYPTNRGPLDSQPARVRAGNASAPARVGSNGGKGGDETEQGVCDLTGNVREWCLDEYHPYRELLRLAGQPEDVPLRPLPEPPLLTRTEAARGDYVVRGASWSENLNLGQAFRRQRLAGGEQVNDVGFRVVIECPPPVEVAAP